MLHQLSDQLGVLCFSIWEEQVLKKWSKYTQSSYMSAVFVLLVVNCLLAEEKESPLLPGESFSTGHFEWKDAGLEFLFHTLWG